MEYDVYSLLPAQFKKPKQHEVYTLLMDLRNQLEDRMPQVKFTVEARMSAQYPIEEWCAYSLIGRKATRTFTFFTIDASVTRQDSYPVTLYTESLNMAIHSSEELVTIIKDIMDSESVAAKVAQLQ